MNLTRQSMLNFQQHNLNFLHISVSIKKVLKFDNHPYLCLLINLTLLLDGDLDSSHTLAFVHFYVSEGALYFKYRCYNTLLETH